MNRRLLAVLLLSALTALAAMSTARAVTPDEVLSDPRLEARARAISGELRCMVCQNQSIDDSDAALAKDLRVLVRERLVDGDSDEEVLDYLVARYGEFVLLQPRWNAANALLWLSPAIVLVLGGSAIIVSRRRRSAAADRTSRKLTGEEETRLRQLLDDASY